MEKGEGSCSRVLVMVIEAGSLSEGESPVDSRQVQVHLLPHNLIDLLLKKSLALYSINVHCRVK